MAGQRASTVISAVGRHSTPRGQKYLLPTQAFDDKIQIPALTESNAGICSFEWFFLTSSSRLISRKGSFGFSRPAAIVLDVFVHGLRREALPDP